MFSNLVANAFFYYDKFKKPSHIKIVGTSDKQQAVIIVSDNGIGIEEKRLARIFDMFYKASERSKGSGLGLYILKETLHKIAGSIEVKSVFGQGTTFTVTIPNLIDRKAIQNLNSIKEHPDGQSKQNT